MANHLESGHILRSGNYTYEIIKVLGQGGFGITYLAETTLKVGNVDLRVKFAIKEHFIASDCEREQSSSRVIYSNPVKERVENSRKDFISEAKRLQKVGAEHKNIVKVNEIFEDNNTAYYVMEYLEGESLREYVRRNGRLSPEKMKEIMMPIAEVVTTLHRNNMTHLDIKPDNIMLVKGDKGEMRPVLIDFGLSKHYAKDGTPTSTINTLGCSDGYSPIEQYAGITSFSPTADIYAFGATMYYCLTGKTPKRVIELKDGELADEVKGIVDYHTYEAIRKATRISKAERENDIKNLFKNEDRDIPLGEKSVKNDNPTIRITGNISDQGGTKLIGKTEKSPKGKTPTWKYILFGVAALIVLSVGIRFYEYQTGMNNDYTLDSPFWSTGKAGNYYYVDLGLPSGTLWSATNYGAEMPWEPGDYLTAEEADTILEITDKGVWRAPTKEEIEELINFTVYYDTKIEFTHGLWFDQNSNHIFLSAAGYEFMDHVSLDGKEGCYWSSTIEKPNFDPETDSYGMGTAWRLNFTKEGKVDLGTKDSNLKFPVRLVLTNSVDSTVSATAAKTR